DQEAVARFYREMEVASKISHPNLVHAYDAGPVGSTLLIALEYVDGVNLEQRVAKSDRLTVAQACDYVRQSALGLQHAYERGLIHRDIKPSNLILSLVTGPLSFAKTGSAPDANKGQRTSDKGQIIKILDLGLARLQQPAANSATSN